jgi:type II secretory ATPase GspE/PulE/Tfp pilus assembly ATPase PilB-like protein
LRYDLVVKKIGPDTTANLQFAAALDVTGRLAVPVSFSWPAPPYYEFTASAFEGPDDCLLVFRDGSKAVGILEGFSPDDMLVRFQQAGSRSVTIAFSGLSRLELLRPVAMPRQKLPEGMEERVFAPSDCQPFSVDMVEGKRFQGETVGYIEALCGLFLFTPEREGFVVRQFVPAAAIESRIVGKPIGQLLVDDKLASAEVVDEALERQKVLRNRRFGEYLTQNEIVSPEQLNAALKEQRAQPVQKLGDTLVQLGHLSAADLKEALAIEARNHSIPLGQILADMGVVDAQVVKGVMAKKLGIPFVNLRTFDIAPEILKRIAPAMAYRYQVVPLAESDNALVIAVDNPMNMAKMDQLRFITGAKFIAVMASEDDIRAALERSYGPAPERGGSAPERKGKTAELPLWRPSDAEVPVEELTARLAAESGEVELGEESAGENDTTLVKLVNKIIMNAVEQKASDIHIEANSGGKSTRVRFRKDGILVKHHDLPARFRKAVVSRLKIMAQLDITERRKPQDGKIDFSRFGPMRVELRVATIPTSNGLEDVVLRVLSAATLVPLESLGFGITTVDSVKRLISRSHGLFIVCGPTGSGKTTSLHALLGVLNVPERKIWTAEDPIEIAQPGLRQVQVNAKIGWTFANAMRSFMRGDPDVIMVGEMRDAETAKIAIEASLTGHLVLSTLHTNGAVESLVRLLDLGMDPFNFADALLGILAQRLVRQLCPNCKTPYTPASGELEELASEYCTDTALQAGSILEEWRRQLSGPERSLALHRAQGCERCNGSGYQGRIGVYELLVADAEIKRLVQARSPVAEIVAVAMAKGMHSLKQDGIAKVLQGLTDLRQVRAM